MEIQTCNNCGKRLTPYNETFPEDAIELINRYSAEKKETYCVQCGKGLYKKSLKLLQKEKNAIIKAADKYMKRIPVLTIQSPMGWVYETRGIVSGQSTTGTGVLAEFKSGFSDFLGGQSGSFNKKIAAGEEMAIFQMKVKALGKGGNAVIAVDIDYAELGAAKGMIMVSAAGTAVKLKNPEILGSFSKKDFEPIEEYAAKLEKLAVFKTYKI